MEAGGGFEIDHFRLGAAFRHPAGAAAFGHPVRGRLTLYPKRTGPASSKHPPKHSYERARAFIAEIEGDVSDGFCRGKGLQRQPDMFPSPDEDMPVSR